MPSVYGATPLGVGLLPTYFVVVGKSSVDGGRNRRRGLTTADVTAVGECQDKIGFVEVSVAIPITVCPAGVARNPVVVFATDKYINDVFRVELAVKVGIAKVGIQNVLDHHRKISPVELVVTRQIKLEIVAVIPNRGRQQIDVDIVDVAIVIKVANW